jgi:hypothetical protein
VAAEADDVAPSLDDPDERADYGRFIVALDHYLTALREGPTLLNVGAWKVSHPLSSALHAQPPILALSPSRTPSLTRLHTLMYEQIDAHRDAEFDVWKNECLKVKTKKGKFSLRTRILSALQVRFVGEQGAPPAAEPPTTSRLLLPPPHMMMVSRPPILGRAHERSCHVAAPSHRSRSGRPLR